MKKNKPTVSPINFKPKPIVLAVQHALPYLVALGLSAAVISPAVGRSGDSAAAFTATQLIRQFTLKNTVAQVSQGMQGYVAEFNGVLRASEMGTVVGGYPVDMGSVPSSVNLPQRDGAGRPLGYCAWDNSASTSNSSFLAGQGVANPLVYAVVSPGLNGSMETSCAYILANRRGLGDDYVQVTAPSQTSSKQFKSAVGTYAELTAMPGEEGDIRLVLQTNKLYSYVGGAWQPVDASKFNDDSAANGAGAIAYTTGKVTVADFQAASATITGALSGSAATFTSSVTANSFVGNGAALTDLNASNVSSGVLGAAFGGTGVDSSAAAQGSLLIGTGAGFALGAISAGNGIGVLNGAGSITISNTGVLSITGTNNQITASAANGDVILSLPQDIATTSTPTFAGAMFNGNIDVASISQAGVPATLAFQYASDTGSTFYPEPNLGLGTGALAGRKNAGNVAIGMDVLGRMATLGYYDESGTWNTGVGYQALYSNDYGDENTAVGYKSLYSNTTGYYNTAMGSQSMLSNTTGTANTAIGYDAMRMNTTGSGNTSLGVASLHNNTTGYRNVALGRGAMYYNTTGYRNAMVGQAALHYNTEGHQNAGVGQASIYLNTTGYYNASVGAYGLYFNTTGAENSSVGANSLFGNVSGNRNSALGYQANVLSGALNYASAIGADSRVGTSDTVVLGALGVNKNSIYSTIDDQIVIGSTARNDTFPNTKLYVEGNVNLNGDLYAANATFSGAVNFQGGVLIPTDQKLRFGGDFENSDSQFIYRSNFAGDQTLMRVVIGDNPVTFGHPQADEFQIGRLEGDQVTYTPVFRVAGNGDVIASGTVSATRLVLGDYSGGVSEPNIAIGAGALASPASGVGANLAIGFYSLNSNTSGQKNVAIGNLALRHNTTGLKNTALGYAAFYNNNTGSNNTALGDGAAFNNTSGNNNTALGQVAMFSNTSGVDNTAIGQAAMFSNTTGYLNTIVGRSALYYNTTGYQNTALGAQALLANTTGIHNTAVGSFGLWSNTTGDYNSAVGQSALALNTTGVSNVAVGQAALYANTTGYGNNAVGVRSLQANTTGFSNAALGERSLQANTTGALNTALGDYSLANNTSGDRNTAVGAAALLGNTTGQYNTALGRYAGYATFSDSTTNANTTGSLNTFLGAYAMPGTAVQLTHATAIGAETLVTTSNTVVLGRTIDNIVMGATGDDGSGNKLQVTGGLRASGNVFLNTGTAANYTQLRDLRVMSSVDDAGWDHLRIYTRGRKTSIDAGGAEDGLVFRVGQGNSGGVGDQTYNTVLTLKADQSAVFTGRVDVQSLYVNGEQIGPVNKANIDTALTFASTVGAAYPQSSLALGVNALDADPRAGNIAIGEGVLTSLSPSAINTEGIFNTGVGFNALTLNSTGSNNTAVGTYSLNRNTTGYANTAIGVYAMVNTTTGFDNTGVGVNALNANTTGNRNNAVGVNALISNSSGAQNNALGTNSLFSNTTGYQNVAVGDNAMYTNSAGYQNVAVGPDALYNNTAGYQNIAIGYNSQRNTTTGYRNTAVGANALLNNTDGFQNSALGVNALLANTSGDYNSAFGTNSMLSNTLGDRNVAMGFNALQANTTGSSNVAVGVNAMLKNTTGKENTAVGDNALFENTTGHSNAAMGRGALYNNTTGYYNIAVGRNALLTNSTGYNNSALGYNSLIFNTTGYNNSALGRNALQNNTTGLNNTALGTFSMFGSTTGLDNTSVGFNTLYSNTTGNANLALGKNALFGNATGSYNMGIGTSTDVLLNNLNYASAIGAFARVTTSNTLVLGALGVGKDGVVSSIDDQVVIGASSRNDTISNTIFHVAGVSNFSSMLYATGGAQVSSNQLLRFGGNQEGTDTVGIYRTNTASDQSLLRIGIGDNADTFGTGTTDEFQVGRLNPDNSFNPVFRVAGNGDVIASGYMQATAFNVSSDRRLKTNIQAQDSGSVLSRLEQLQTYSYEYLANPNLGRRIGVIAQEIQSLFPEAVATRADGMMSVDYSALGAMAAMGVGQLSKQVKVLDKTVADQGQRITVLDDRINQHDTRITSLESWRTDASKRMDGMQTAIDLNIQKIAENAVAIQTNSVAIERLDDALFTLDGQVKNNSDLINNINSRWAKNFSESADGSLLTVNAVELKVSNFTAQQLRANSVYSQRLEAEMARIADLEVNNLKANSAVANTVQAEQVNTGSAQVYAGVGLPAVLFAAKSDGHYTVSTSALDGSYATATVIVNAGQAKVVSVASEGIELYAEGNQVKVIAAGKSIKASWIKMG
ncbi:tail fiber domain-containing protein [Limnobacter sp.]|uniref:tail fiber domain-containing protein n=1 Tax=Limnobacter sp. TaxID=2003368 RepID=UPI0027345BFD|nr:tail fiber domain-containing protein [Limnobacter sp.]MDP3273006.1 tail fiber domain-containing protein [Limnobacter sp.]